MRRILAVLLVAAFIGMLGAVPASAHASCDKASPADGSQLDTAPSEVYCDYTEPPASNSSMEVIDACGRKADDGQVLIIGPRMGVHMKATAPALYTVRWHATSLKDGHKTFGSWTFTVTGKQTSCSKATPTKPKPTGSSSNAQMAPSATPKGSTSSLSPAPSAGSSARKPEAKRGTTNRDAPANAAPDPLSLAGVAATPQGSSPLLLFILITLAMSAMSFAGARFSPSEDE